MYHLHSKYNIHVHVYNDYTGLNKRHKLFMRYILVLFGDAEGYKQPRKLKVIQSFHVFHS